MNLSPSEISAYEDIGVRLEMLRERLELTKTDFSGLLGVPLQTYVNYANGRSEPPYRVIEKAHEAAKANLAWLITGQGEPNDPDDEQTNKAITKAVQKFGPSRGVNVIREYAMKILRRQIEVKQHRIDYLEEQLREAQFKIRDYEDHIKRLQEQVDRPTASRVSKS